MANTFIGSGIAFGTGSTTSTLTGLGTITLLQSAEMGAESDEALVKDADGNTKSVAKFDHRLKGTIEFVPTSGTAVGTLAVTAYPSAGVTISLTDALLAPFNATFIVDGVTFSRSNTAAMMARISISRYLQNSVP